MNWKRISAQLALTAGSLACFGAFLLLSSILWLEYKFGSVTIESIIFHIGTPLAGTPSGYVASYLKRVAVSFILGAGWFVFMRAVLRRGPGKNVVKILFVLPFFLFLISTFCFAVKFKVGDYITSRLNEDLFMEEHYHAVRSGDAVFPEIRRNVIVLMLESMEETFHERSLFPESLIPRLEKIKNDNISCQLVQGPNLNWTVASLTGLVFGLPLNLPVNGNDYSSSEQLFLPGADSLLELFERNGYSISLIAGSDTSFAGIKNIFLNHAAQPNIYDLSFFKERTDREWGLDDKRLYQKAKERLLHLHAQESPFFVIIQTIDTHSTARSYGDYPEPHGDARDAFVAADYMADAFLGWLSEQEFYADTTILVVGDHRYMGNRLGDAQLRGERRLYNVFINTVFAGKPDLRHRRATMLDMGPSMLQAAGISLPEGRFGLGVSIFSDAPTLVECYKEGELSRRLKSRSRLYDRFLSGLTAEGETD